MRIVLNGEPLELPEGSTVSDLVDRASAGEARRGSAVAVDSEVVPRSAWDGTKLEEGQKVELLTAIQGG